MLKYSAGYIKINPNFVIQNIKASKNNHKPIFAILHNLLSRGCPTIPSKYLQKHFNSPKIYDKFQYAYSFENCNWDNKIKGGSEKNPAQHFYNDILPKAIGETNAKTFIAECPITDIIESFTGKKNIPEQVDFYSPLFNAVIEIDGSQHKTDSEQRIKDLYRDKILTSNNISIIRIKTSELEDYNAVSTKLKFLKTNKQYKDAIYSKYIPTEPDINYMLAIRMEMLMLSLFENNYIRFDDNTIKLNILSTDNVNKNIFEIIINDFLIWLKNICLLQNIDYSIPSISINIVNSELELSKGAGINIYISTKEIYSYPKFENVIYIKNDYFLYQEDLVSKDNTTGIKSYLYKKNHFFVQSENISYKLTKSKHAEALTFVLSNLSNIYEDFRDNQLDIILECLNNRSVIGILPTGAGKSLCYQLASMLIPSCTLVIAPLQLLMVDQFINIKYNLGIRNITYINSTVHENLEIFKTNKSLITIVSPERFFSEKFTSSLANHSIDVGFIVIDEAHCLSEWGHDFRTSYLWLSHNLNRFLPSSTFLMALTGTASPRVFEDINCELQTFTQKRINTIFADNMRRDNLTITVKQTNDKYKELINNITTTLQNKNKDKTLVFTKKKKSINEYDSACITLTNTIKNTETISNPDIVDYYAGGDELEPEKKLLALQRFKNGDSLIVLATKAFGMGIDIPDIRKTIHYGLPSSFESLYQQVGRAGRDGKPSNCYIYYTPENKDALDLFFRMPPIGVKEMKSNLKKLNELQTNFYFIQSSNLDEEIEKRVITRILEGIKTRNRLKKDFVDCRTIINGPFNEISDPHLTEICKQADSAKTVIERALYRLYLLGEINMWSLVYDVDVDNPTFNRLTLTNLSEEEKLEKLKTHIEKYETNFTFNQENTFENRLSYLIKWVNETYLQEQIQTLKTLYEQCENYTTPTAFMDYISSYFSNDPVYVRLVNKDISLKYWIEALKPHPEKTKARIARLLESYDKIDALNYVSGITRLRLDEFDSTDGKRRLDLALDSVSNYSKEDRMYLFKNTYTLLHNANKDQFVESWLEHNKDDSIEIYNATNSQVCENYLIINFANELLKIGEAIDDRLQ